MREIIVENNEKGFFSLVSKYRKELMGFAALWILFFHEWICLFSQVPVLGQIEYLTKNFGYVGVDIFIFLSGMGLVFSIEKSTVLKFYSRRFSRILFPFIVVEAIACALSGYSFLEFIQMVTGYSFFATSIFTVLWFVPTIAIFYLLFPLYYRFFSKAHNQVFFTITAIEIWLLFSVKFTDTMRWDLFGVTNRIPIFLLGILLGWFGKNKDIVVNRSFKISMYITLLLGLYLCYLTNQRDFNFMVPLSNVAVPALLVAISLCFILTYVLDLRNFTVLKKILRFYGTISFELYCVQELLGKYVISWLAAKMPYVVVNLIFLIIVTLVAYALYFVNSFFSKLASK